MSKSNVVLSADSQKAVKVFVGLTVKSYGATSAMLDALAADGVMPDMLRAAKAEQGEKKPEESALIKSVKAAIVSGFTVAQQGLLLKDTKTLSETKKKEKRTLQQSIGSLLGDIRDGLQRRIDRANREAERALVEAAIAAGTAQPVIVNKSQSDKYRKTLATLIDQMSKAENLDCADVVDALKHLRAAQTKLQPKAAKAKA